MIIYVLNCYEWLLSIQIRNELLSSNNHLGAISDQIKFKMRFIDIVGVNALEW